MAELRLLTMDHSYADLSTSISPAIERAMEEHRSVDTAVLGVFPEDSITVGYLEDPEKCLHLDYCREAGIPVRRRRNTGGAILGARGAVFLMLSLDARSSWVPMKSIADGFRVSLTAMAGALRASFDVDAVYRPMNDVEVSGRKLVAASARLEQDVLTLRYILNVPPMNQETLRRAMKTPPEKMADKAIQDATRRISCLEAEVGRAVSRGEIMTLTRRFIAGIFGPEVGLVPGELNPLEGTYAAQYEAVFTTEAWLHANSEAVRFQGLPPDCRRVEGCHKAPAGLIRTTLMLREGRIHDVIITGDFHPKPLGIVGEMEEALRGAPASLEALEARIQGTLDRPRTEIPGVSLADFSSALAKALAAVP